MTAKICIEQIQHWEANFSLAKISSKPGFMVVKDDWVGALYYGGPSMDQFLWDGPSYYHDRIHGFPVAYGFDFRIEPDGQITAAGTLYNASRDINGDLDTFTDEPLTHVDLRVTFHSPDTHAAVAHYVQKYQCPIEDCPTC